VRAGERGGAEVTRILRVMVCAFKNNG